MALSRIQKARALQREIRKVKRAGDRARGKLSGKVNKRNGARPASVRKKVAPRVERDHDDGNEVIPANNEDSGTAEQSTGSVGS